jgi:hypothetical protein
VEIEMVRVTLELLPHGSKRGIKEIGKIEIWNDGTGTGNLGNYGYRIYHGGKYAFRAEVYKTGSIKGFPRKWSPYRLLQRVLKDARET